MTDYITHRWNDFRREFEREITILVQSTSAPVLARIAATAQKYSMKGARQLTALAQVKKNTPKDKSKRNALESSIIRLLIHMCRQPDPCQRLDLLDFWKKALVHEHDSPLELIHLAFLIVEMRKLWSSVEILSRYSAIPARQKRRKK